MPLFHPLMDGLILTDLGPTCSKQVPLQIFLVPEVSIQVLLVCTDPKPQSPWESSPVVCIKCPVAPQLGCFPRSWARTQQPWRQKWQLWSLPFLRNAPEMLWETARETKSLRPLCSKQEFYYASRLMEDKFAKPWALIIVRRWVIYPQGGLCKQGFFVVYGVFASYRKTSWLQDLQPLTPLIECGYSCRKPCRASWGLQYCRATRKLLADSVWGNQGKFQTYNKSQKMAKKSPTVLHVDSHNDKYDEVPGLRQK
jgi:hypothetical protein